MVETEIVLLRCNKCGKVILTKINDSQYHRCSACRSNDLKKIIVKVTNVDADEIVCVQNVKVRARKEEVKEQPVIQPVAVPEAKKPVPEPVKAPVRNGVDDEFVSSVKDTLRGVWERTGSYSRVEEKARELFNRYKQKLESKYWIHDERELVEKWFKP